MYSKYYDHVAALGLEFKPKLKHYSIDISKFDHTSAIHLERAATDHTSAIRRAKLPAASSNV